jgi:hypothetical protein
MKQRSIVSNGRGRDGRFTKGNRFGFKPGQSGNPKGRPAKVSEYVDLLDRLTAEQHGGYAVAGRMLAEKYRRDPEARIGLNKALRLLIA